MTVSIGNGVSTGNIVTSEVNPLTGGIGFLTVSDGEDITDRLKKEMLSGEKVYIYGHGTVYISETIYIESGADIYIYSGVTIKQRPGTNKTMFKSRMFVDAPASVVLTWSAGFDCSVNMLNHNKSVGDAVWLYGADQSQYRGVFYVNSVVDANNFVVKLKRVPAAAPTGTIYCVKATQNVRITCSGVIDYDQANNSSATGPDKIAVILGGANVTIDGFRGINALKYVLSLGAVRDFCIKDFDSKITNSDGIKVYGPAFDGEIRRVTGSFGDDCVSVQTLEPAAYIGYQFSFGGDVVSVKSYEINPSRATTGAFKLYPSANEYMDDCGVDGVSVGECPGVVNSLYAPHNNSQVGHVWFRGMRSNNTSNNVFKTLGNTGLTVKKLELANVASALGATSPTIDIGSQLVADTLYVSGVRHTGNSVSLNVGAANISSIFFYDNHSVGSGGLGRVVSIDVNATIGRIALNRNFVRGNETLVMSASTASSSIVVDACENNVDTPSLIQIGRSNSVVNLTNNTVSNATSGMVRVRDNGTIHINDLGGNKLGAGSYFAKQSGSEVVSVSGLGASVDITALARKDGAIVYNSNAAANNGTDGACGTGVFVCVGTSVGSWKRLGTVGGSGNQY